MLQVNPVDDRQKLRQFIRLPWSIYSDDPAWVPPLMLERKELLSPHNPYFEHARYQSWIAYRDGTAVGRISAQIDQLHLEQQQAGSDARCAVSRPHSSGENVHQPVTEQRYAARLQKRTTMISSGG